MFYGKQSGTTQSKQRVELARPKFGAHLADDQFLSAGLTARKLLRNREIECLRWVAEGKTSIEISKIIDLSEHTVNHYLAACCKKLDAVNRVQAAVKAVRLGIV